MTQQAGAKVVVLKQTQESVPPFYRYAVRLSARGHIISTGDKLTVYKVDSTDPEGPVMVTDATEFVFAN